MGGGEGREHHPQSGNLVLIVYITLDIRRPLSGWIQAGFLYIFVHFEGMWSFMFMRTLGLTFGQDLILARVFLHGS